MSTTAAVSRTARLADFELDLQSGELRQGDVTTRLPEQPFRILLVLLERPGEVVTREELRSRVWTADTFVDFDTGLNSAMRKLREALGDSAEHPRFIETLPRRGYRLIAPVADRSTTEVPVARPLIRRWKVLVAIAVTAVVIGGGVAAFRFSRSAPLKIKSIAVLPLTNLTADRAQDYFADGLTDALITELSQLRDVRVISRTSTSQYRNRPKSLPEIAKELNIEGVVEGTVVRAGSRVRITAQLRYAPNGRRLWNGSYERELGDIENLQRELAGAVAAAVRAELGERGGRAARSTVPMNPQAYDSLLRSRAANGKGTIEGLKEAIAYAQDATVKQPDFASAWATMARYYINGAFAGLLSPHECMRRAEVAARRAVDIDPMLAEGHLALGIILYRFHWKWQEAETQFRRALQLAPSGAEAHRTYAVFLAAQGRSDEAVREAERAIALDPLHLQARQDLGYALRAAGRFDEAISAYRKALAVDPNAARAHFQLGRTYIAAGDTQKAIEELEIAVELSKRNPRYLYHLGYAYGASGRTDDGRRILDELTREKRYVSPFGLALVHTGLGDRASALAALEKAYAEQAFELFELRETTAFASLYAEPRFQQLLTRIGLPSRHF